MDEERINEMKEWSAEEQAQHLCPNGVMTLEEFRALGHQLIDEEYDRLEQGAIRKIYEK